MTAAPSHALLDPPRTPSRTADLMVPAAAAVLTSGGSLSTLWLAGPGLGVLFGACLTAALLAPALAAAPSVRQSALATAGVAVGCAAGPVVALLGGQLPTPIGLTGAAVAASLAVAAGGAAAFLVACRAPASVAALCVTTAALLWLAWPVWLSPYLPETEAWFAAKLALNPALADALRHLHLEGGVVADLSAAHPLLSLDAAVTRAGGGNWVQQKLMYGKLTSLQQHVLPSPPAAVTATLAWHAGVGCAGMAVAWVAERRRGRRTNRPEPRP